MGNGEWGTEGGFSATGDIGGASAQLRSPWVALGFNLLLGELLHAKTRTG